MKPATFGGAVNARREGALHRLKLQLKDGTKDYGYSDRTEPLSDKDKIRIDKEIAIPESRITTYDAARATRTKKAAVNRRSRGFYA